uniref:Ig-like domain-containing protein n=1 Tax=Monopterus albus TaxID=43700 RepID=A0A3Q3IX99_MONAL
MLCWDQLWLKECKVTGSPVRAEVGADVTLTLEPRSMGDETVKWKRQETLVHRYRSQGDDPDDQDEKFKDRTSLFCDEFSRGNISFKPTKVALEDTGSFTCSVPKVCGQDNEDGVTLCVSQFTPLQLSWCRTNEKPA